MILMGGLIEGGDIGKGALEAEEVEVFRTGG
jgi:hypothetical protein